MTPVVTNTVNNLPFIPGIPFITKKHNNLKKINLVRCSTKQTLFSQKYNLTPSPSLHLFPKLRNKFAINQKLKATSTDLALEEAESIISNENSPSPNPESPSKSTPTPTPYLNKRAKPSRKSEMPPVKPEDLVPGAKFSGKVRSIQPFGAFIDFGAFTDGLVHVSQLSDGFVKDVSSIVSIGQEVSVRVVEVNAETKRISLSMKENVEGSTQKGAGPTEPSRKRENTKKGSKFKIGQNLEGTVKNLTRSGAYISLPEGEEGFLPQEEESDGGFSSMMGGSPLQVGQEVSVRVLRFSRGKVTLTMKKEENVKELDSKLSSGVVFKATNPFLVAFRKNEDIASFLDEREKEVERETIDTESVTNEEVPETQVDEDVAKEEVEDVSSETVPEDKKVEASLEEKDTFTTAIEENEITEIVENVIEGVAESKQDDVIAKDENEEPDTEDVSSITSSGTIQEIEVTEEVENVIEEVAENQEDDVIAKDENEEPKTEDTSSISSSSTIQEDEVTEEVENVIEVVAKSQDIIAKDENEEPNIEDTSIVTNSETIQENEVSKEVENEIDATEAKEIETETSDIVTEVPSATLVEEKVESPAEQITEEIEESKEVENVIKTPITPIEDTDVKPVPEESTTKATISPALVKQLRDETGAGMMDCKNALSSTGGDLIKAQEFLRKKGLLSADKKSSRITAEGRIGSYIHDSRIGVLIEVNCETDFVSRGEIFKELVDDLAMQVAACPQVEYLNTDDVDKEIIEREREIEMQKEDLLSKPENIRGKIVDGRIKKRVEELALLEQNYIKNDKILVKDWVKQTIATIGENIKVKRFVRFNLGEGLQKKSQDFAAEVAAQTAATSAPPPVKDQPAAVVAEKPAEPKAAVSAALVKQLRDETGAGMMDCKKALSETGGDLEKAQEYLRKKGLSTADKKSSRIAAEGRIGSYIHDTRIGALIEVNCETDFVGRSEKFKELADDLAMQIVACPQVRYVSIEDIPEDIVKKEKEMEMQRDDLKSKSESIRERIVEGRVSKRLGELALLEQAFIKDDNILVKDLVKQTVAGLGENIKVRRFVRFTLGESNEKMETENEA